MYMSIVTHYVYRCLYIKCMAKCTTASNEFLGVEIS